MDLSALNYLAILVAAVSSFAIGSLWYSPILFGKTWQREAGLTDENIKNSNMLKIFGLTFVLSLIIAFNLAAFLGTEATLSFGLCAGAAAGFGWVATALGILYLFEHRSFKLWLINAGYHAVTFTIMGGIIGAWR
jgi:hypothetical protein